MNKAVKILTVLILVSVAFYVPVVVNGYDECEGQPESESEAEEYRTGHVERGERGDNTPLWVTVTPAPTLKRSYQAPEKKTKAVVA